MSEPKRYRKKPVVIEAMQFDGSRDSAIAIKSWIGDDRIRIIGEEPPLLVYISTLEGDMLVSSGDFVIKGVQGEFYPCKPDIFEATYEEVFPMGPEVATESTVFCSDEDYEIPARLVGKPAIDPFGADVRCEELAVDGDKSWVRYYNGVYATVPSNQLRPPGG